MPRRGAAAHAALLGLLMGSLAGCGWMAVPPPKGARPAGSAAGVAPPQSSAPARPGSVTVQAGDTVYAIARRNNSPIRAVIEANNLQPPYVLRPGQVLVVPHPETHLVKPGDTVYGIARQHGVEASAIVRANDIAPPYKIVVGQLLILPGPANSGQAPVQQASAAEIRHVEQLPPQPGATQGAPATAGARSPPSPSSGPSGIVAVPLPPPGGTKAAASSMPAASAPAASGNAEAQPSSAPVSAPPLPPAPPSTGSVAQGGGTADGVETSAGSQTGQKFAALPPADAAPAPRALGTPGGRFLWPLHGKLLSGFGPKEGGLYNDGINIAASPGEPVVAAEDGVVAYAGNEIRGFGNLVLIKHADGWMTAYAHNEKLLVKRGERVKRGQTIARAGSSGSVGAPQLHFEIRKGSHPVDPMKYLAALSS